MCHLDDPSHVWPVFSRCSSRSRLSNPAGSRAWDMGTGTRSLHPRCRGEAAGQDLLALNTVCLETKRWSYHRFEKWCSALERSLYETIHLYSVSTQPER